MTYAYNEPTRQLSSGDDGSLVGTPFFFEVNSDFSFWEFSI